MKHAPHYTTRPAWCLALLAGLTLALAACGGGDGAPGTPGVTGAAGTAGKKPVSQSSPEPVAANCEAGGVRLQTGLDNQWQWCTGGC